MSSVAGTSAISQTQAEPSIASSTSRLANQEVFLKLLVAQIQNQNPMKPADGVEFMTQLAQFTELEQMMGVKKELEAIHKVLDPGTSTSTDKTEKP